MAIQNVYSGTGVKPRPTGTSTLTASQVGDIFGNREPSMISATGGWNAPFSIPAYTIPGAMPRTGGTGVVASPLSGFGFRGTQNEKTKPTQQGIRWDDIISRVGQPYGTLQARLADLVNAERGNIQSGASRAATYLSEMDPMAAYRETIPALQAPTAAASTYLGAIGADPAQVQALQNLQNQMLSSQATGQTNFGQAVDTSQNNYRLAQLADVYANQQRADAALGQQYGAQTAAIDMARINQENAVRQQLLELQLQLVQMAASKDGSSRALEKQGLDFASLLGALGVA
jgi:hypothetical protein